MCKEGSLLQGTAGLLPCAQCTAVQRHQLIHQPTASTHCAWVAPGASTNLSIPGCTSSSSPVVSCAHSIFMPWYKVRYRLSRYWQLQAMSQLFFCYLSPLLPNCFVFELVSVSWLTCLLLYQNESMASLKGLTTNSSSLNERKQNKTKTLPQHNHPSTA